MMVKGMASGNLVDAHIIIKIYWFQELVFGKAPTHSIMTLQNGCKKAGIGLRGATGIFWFGFPTI